LDHQPYCSALITGNRKADQTVKFALRQCLKFNCTDCWYSFLFGITWPSDLWQTNFVSYKESTSSPIRGLFIVINS